MENMLKLDPKSMSGRTWDEGGKTKIVQILISHTQSVIRSIQFVYVVDGKVLRSEIYGQLTGFNFDMVTLDHPTEYLTSVSSQYSNGDFGQLVSFAFGTNIRKYGPFGSVPNTSDPQFVYNFTPRCSFGGFYGSVQLHSVYAIGVYIRPFESLAEIETHFGRDKD